MYTPAAQPVMTSVLPVLCCGPPSAPSPPAGVAPECVCGGDGGSENKLFDADICTYVRMYLHLSIPLCVRICTSSSAQYTGHLP